MRIRDLREDKDLTQKEIARLLSITQATYQRYESGEIPLTAEKIVKLALFYDVSTDYILGLTNKKERNK